MHLFLFFIIIYFSFFLKNLLLEFNAKGISQAYGPCSENPLMTPMRLIFVFILQN